MKKIFELFIKYAKHLNYCDKALDTYTAKCTCGLDKVIAEIEDVIRNN